VKPVLRRAFEKNRGYPEVVCEIHVAYAGMEPRYRTTSALSCQRCRLIDLDVLSSRRRVSCALFINCVLDVLSCKLDCPIILSSLRLNVYLYNTRYRFLIKEDPHCTNYGMNDPLNGAISHKDI
jgi:hypothetical protein